VDVLRRLVAERGAAGRGGRHAIAAPSDAGSLRGRTHCGGWPAIPATSSKSAGHRRRSTLPRPYELRTCSTARFSRPGELHGPVLLVDDTIRSRWTTTVAAALLADAGATSVLPLAIHQLP
jgi:hypothetical protein